MKTSSLVQFICIVCLIFTTITAQSSSPCPLQSDNVNKQILNTYTIPCLQKALLHGWQQTIEYLIQQKSSQHQIEFIKIFQQQVKRLQILQQQIVLGSSEMVPILKWGQNRTHLFITFKLSHRWDSPPCLYTQSQKSRLEEDVFFYNNVCLVSHQRISFMVSLNLFRKVFLSMKDIERQRKQAQSSQSQQDHLQARQENSNSRIQNDFAQYTFDVKKDGVGQYSTILLKQTPQIWTFLTKEQKIYPIWHQISQRYTQDFNQYQQNINAYKTLQKQRSAQGQTLGASQSQL